MGFKIDNPELEEKIRELAKLRNQSVTDAINFAVKEELKAIKLKQQGNDDIRIA